MPSLNFNYEHPPFEKTIQLYGDRAGGQGNFEFAGLAVIDKVKVVLLKGNQQSLEQPADWRRFLRLINLAQRLEKPVLLWNLSIVHVAANQHYTSLALGTAIKDTKLQLLQIPQPIVTFFDETYEWNTAVQELGWADGAVIVRHDKEEELPALPNLKVVSEQTDISKQILELLQKLSKVPSEELVANRLRSFSLPTEIQS